MVYLIIALIVMGAIVTGIAVLAKHAPIMDACFEDDTKARKYAARASAVTPTMRHITFHHHNQWDGPCLDVLVYGDTNQVIALCKADEDAISPFTVEIADFKTHGCHMIVRINDECLDESIHAFIEYNSAVDKFRVVLDGSFYTMNEPSYARVSITGTHEFRRETIFFSGNFIHMGDTSYLHALGRVRVPSADTLITQDLARVMSEAFPL